MDATQLLVVLKDFRGNFSSQAILGFLMSHLAGKGTIVPVILIRLFLSFSHAFSVALLGNTGCASSIRLVRGLRSVVVFLGLLSLVPFVSHFLFPIRFFLDLDHALLNNSKGLAHFKVLHILLVVEFVREF